MKQYLMMCSDKSMEDLKALFHDTIQFLEVQGMNMQGGNVNVLVTPIIPPVTPMPPLPMPEAQEEPKDA